MSTPRSSIHVFARRLPMPGKRVARVGAVNFVNLASAFGYYSKACEIARKTVGLSRSRFWRRLFLARLLDRSAGAHQGIRTPGLRRIGQGGGEEAQALRPVTMVNLACRIPVPRCAGGRARLAGPRAPVVELVDALDSKSSSERSARSTRARGTILNPRDFLIRA
jgi:hypothetical protein